MLISTTIPPLLPRNRCPIPLLITPLEHRL
jgi:hypothetical protein